MNLSDENLTELINDIDSEFSRLLKLCILVPINLLSIPLTFYTTIYLYKRRVEQRTLSDIILIILLLVSFIDILINQSGVMIYFRLSFIWPQNSMYCIVWNYFNYLDYYLNLYLTVWASIERHILIFHHTFFDRNIKKFYFHKLPLIIIICYGILIYLVLIIFNPCINHFQMNQPWCGSICFTQKTITYLYDWFINSVFPICLIIILNITLIIRVIKRKNHIQTNQLIWKRCRKLTIQMITISSIYLICFLPSGIITILRSLLADSKFGEQAMQTCFRYTFLLANALLPYVTLSSLPELRKKIKLFIRQSKQFRVFKIRPIVTNICD
ncbi:hypothetical protein I4U23_006090 [Adineta vaga]|nr:hypothetical protein I4U23_006090 [Adineta vaga]